MPESVTIAARRGTSLTSAQTRKREEAKNSMEIAIHVASGVTGQWIVGLTRKTRTSAQQAGGPDLEEMPKISNNKPMLHWSPTPVWNFYLQGWNFPKM